MVLDISELEFGKDDALFSKLLVELRCLHLGPSKSVEDISSLESESVQVGKQLHLMLKNQVVDLKSRVNTLEHALLGLDVVQVGQEILHFLLSHLDEILSISDLSLSILDL